MKVRTLLACVVVASLVTACGSETTDQDYLARAKQTLEKGDLSVAAIELKNALAKNADNVEARWLLGKVYLKQGDAAAAEKELLVAGDLGVGPERLNPVLVRAYVMQGKFDEVLQVPSEGLAEPERAEILAAQAMARMTRGDLAAAQSTLEQAAALMPDSPAVLTEQARLEMIRGNNQRALEILGQVLAGSDATAAGWSLMGELELREGNREKAEEALSKAIERGSVWSDLLKRALLRIDLGKYEEAQADIDALLKFSPEHFEFNYAQGLVYFRQEQYTKALEFFTRAEGAQPRFYPAVFFLGATHHILGNEKQADQYISRYVAAVPDNAIARKLLAEIRLEQGDYAEVERLLGPVLQVNESDTGALRMLASTLAREGNIDGAVEKLQQAVALEPDSAEVHVALGAALLERGDHVAGVSQHRRGLEIDPASALAYTSLTQHYLGQKDFASAAAVAEEFRQQSPDLPGPYTLMAAVKLSQGDKKSGWDLLQQARKKAPGDLNANRNLARLALQERDLATARQCYEEVLAHHADDLDALMSLAVLDEQEKRADDMVARLERAVAAHPDAVQPRAALARYHISKGQPDKAMAVLSEVRQASDDDPMLLTVLGQAQLAQGDGAAAKTTLKQLVSLRPGSADAHFLLAKAHAQLGEAEAVIAELESAVNIDPAQLQARLALARVLVTQREYDRARQQLGALKGIAPENPDVLLLEGDLARAGGEQGQARDLYAKAFENVSSTTTMLALVQQEWAMGEHERALSRLQEWVESNPGDVSVRLRLAEAYQALGKTADATGQYNEILALSAKNVLALNNLAWQLRDANPAQALKYAEQAHSLAGESPDVADTYAVVLMKNGETERALRLSEQALEKKRSPDMVYHRAMILDAAGRDEEAVELLVPLLRDSEKTPFGERKEAQELLARLQKN